MPARPGPAGSPAPDRPGWLPPPREGLAPTVAVYRLSPVECLQSLAVLLGLCAFVVVAKGGWPPSRGLMVFLLVGSVYFLLQIGRNRVWAGPGWLATRGLWRTHYVRTREVVSGRDVRSGLDRLILLRDRDGRRVWVPSWELRGEPELAARVREDVQVAVRSGLRLPASTAALLGLGRDAVS